MIARRALLLGALLGASALRLAAQEVPPDPDPRLIAAAGQMALAYVVTGDAAVDRISEAGLAGLSAGLAERTTLVPGRPVGVDLEADDLTLLTVLYWPVTEAQAAPSPQAYLRLNQFMRTGGVIVLDTRDGDIAGLGAPDGSAALQRLAAPLEVPPLVPLPADHVLTRSYYLLDDLPGRYQGAPVWVEAPAAADAGGGSRNDGVSPVIIGGNAWAEAWAVDARGLPLLTVGRGFDGERQREMALRAGMNIVMYVLTGNYKADQVHAAELLQRMGQGDGDAAAGPAPAMPQGWPR